MAKGKLACCGSSLFLKAKYGVGYSFVITKDKSHANASQNIKDVIREHLPDFEVVNDTAGEVFVHTPLSSSAKFPQLLRAIESRKAEIGVTNFGISVTTLEEVFLRIGNDQAATVKDRLETGNLVRRLSSSRLVNERKEEENNAAESEINKLMQESGDKVVQNVVVEWFRHLFALIVKRYYFTKRDIGSFLCLFCIPILMMGVGIAALRAQAAVKNPELVLDLSHYANPVPLPVGTGLALGSSLLSKFPSSTEPFEITSKIVNASSSTFEAYENDTCSSGLYSYSYCQSTDATSYQTDFRTRVAYDFLASAKAKSNIQFGGYVDASIAAPNPPTSVPWIWVYVNASGLHALPTYVNMLSQALLSSASSSETITTSVQAYPETKPQRRGTEIGLAFTLLYLFEFGMIFVPSSTVVHAVLERQSKAKHQQIISGVSITAYWASNYIYDFFLYLFPFSILMVLFKVYGSEFFLGSNFGATFALYISFGISSIPLSYIFSFLFVNPMSARMVVLIISFLTGPILPMVTYILVDLVGPFDADIKKIGDRLTIFGRAFPSFNLGHGLLKMGSNSANLNPWNSDIAGNDIIYMFWTGALYFIILVFMEFLSSVPYIASTIRKGLGIERDVPRVVEQEDDDVIAEKQAIENGQRNNDVVVVKGLRKNYGFLPGRTKLAVKDLWFSIPKGECFGFLGINGAGKTTTLEILSGDIYPTQGGATLAGFDIMTQQIQVRRRIGYCPQFDAIFHLMTAREHLQFYARIKGVKEENMKQIVDGMLHYLSLDEYADRPAGTYSGGNKRKLSVAISLIGDPPIVFLDEPSTGMDPGARRFMWRFIAETMSGRSVILTTHSMEECEALCQRVGIMVSGRLRCLGSAQHLKNKFGKGYQLDISTTPSRGDNLLGWVQHTFPGARLLERLDGALKLQLPPSERYNLADVFEQIENNKETLGVIDYSVSQTSLEQIFIFFAKQQDEEKGVASAFQGTQGLTQGPTPVAGQPAANYDAPPAYSAPPQTATGGEQP